MSKYYSILLKLSNQKRGGGGGGLSQKTIFCKYFEKVCGNITLHKYN
jgi:hypothetical protein